MPKGIPTGTWSKLSFDAIAGAQQMMARALVDITASWGVEDEKSILERMSYEKFTQMLSDADNDPGAADEFNRMLGQALMPLIQQAFAPQQPPGQPGAQPPVQG